MPFGHSHSIIRRISTWAIYSFFGEVQVINGENVPREGPVIIACTHHNMSVDPAVLSVTFPFGRKLHYWAKSTLFKNPIANYILTNSGNIPVNRKVRDNQVLFRGTFEALAAGEVVAIFPEGTSYTEPRIMQIKDGVSWTVLEYFKWLQSPDGAKAGGQDVVVVPVSIVYTDKSRYRSSVVVEYGAPIHVSQYAERFLSEEEGVSRATVKRLTKDIGTQLVQMTVNAPNWDTLYSAKMARRLLWQDDKSIKLDEWVTIYQTLCDLFSAPSPSSSLVKVQTDLLSYYSLLASANLTNSSLSQLPLPRSLDPAHPARLPSRLRTLAVLLRDTIASLARLPFFLLPLLVHIPAYAMGRLGARLAEDEEETQAQTKIFLSLLSLGLVYPTMFLFLWALFWLTPVGFVVAAVTVWGFALYHVRLIDDNYEHAKRLVAAWRVLIGVWGPRRWDLSVSALKTYTTLPPPPPNQWISQPTKKPDATDDTAPAAEPPAAPKAAETEAPAAPPTPKRKRPASRHLIRHVLRARLVASQSLAAFLAEVERSGQNVRAARHLARQFNSSAGIDADVDAADKEDGFLVEDGPQGWRASAEVIGFLRDRGAKIAALEHEGEADWAAVSSGDERVDGDEETEAEDLVWVPPHSP